MAMLVTTSRKQITFWSILVLGISAFAFFSWFRSRPVVKFSAKSSNKDQSESSSEKVKESKHVSPEVIVEDVSDEEEDDAEDDTREVDRAPAAPVGVQQEPEAVIDEVSADDVELIERKEKYDELVKKSVKLLKSQKGIVTLVLIKMTMLLVMMMVIFEVMLLMLLVTMMVIMLMMMMVYDG